MNTFDKTFIVIGALLLSTGAMLSAYGFHGLAPTLTEEDRLAWRWAVQMQTYHALALILVSLLNDRFGPSKAWTLARVVFVLGMIVFCGSIYVTKLGGPAAFGEIAPIGGTSFMVAWLLVALGAFLAKRSA